MARAFRTTLAALACASAFALAAGALRMRQGVRPGGASFGEFMAVFGAVLAAFAGAAAAAAVSAPLLGSKKRGAGRAAAAGINVVLLGFSAIVFWQAFLPTSCSYWALTGLSATSFLVLGAMEVKDIYRVETVRATTVWLACSAGALALAAPVLGLGLG